MRKLLLIVVLVACGGGKPKTGTDPAQGTCIKTGCSGSLCSDKDMVTTCEFKPEYACYQSATCERQADHACGFTQSPELIACIANPPPGAAGSDRPQ